MDQNANLSFAIGAHITRLGELIYVSVHFIMFHIMMYKCGASA